MLSLQCTLAQESKVVQEIQQLSRMKWQWMADKNIAELDQLFHDQSKFVHMSGTWNKDRELEIIESGSIWYKKADVHGVEVEVFDDTAILWNRITLTAHVRGNDVSNEFTVTEIYKKIGGSWKMLDLTFSKARDTHKIQPATSAESKLLQLSKDKWQWMADKDVEKLKGLFHEQSNFVHMGGSWGKQRELDIIESGNIHYKQAEIHEASVEVMDDTAILLNRITLLAVVGGKEVTNPFMVTEVYKKSGGTWQLGSMSFTKLLQ